MINDILIKPEDILLLSDNSITDPETIRQIALYGIKYNDNSLNVKIKKEFEYCGLYPYNMEIYGTIPDNSATKSIFDYICKARKNK